MLPTFTIFGHTVGTYGVCILLGITAGIILAVLYAPRVSAGRDDVFYSMLLGMIGVMVGGKLFYIILNIGKLWRAREVIFSSAEMFAKSMSAGYVFYGGLIGAAAVIFWYIRKYKINASCLFAAVVPSVPLIHAFGRLGCFMAGCCYGKPYSGFGSVTFTHSVAAPNGVALFPSQAAEMLALAVIFLALVLIRRREKNGIVLLALYALFYSAVRFGLEFMRGDTERGIFFGLSTSQWISILLFVIAVTVLIKQKKRKEASYCVSE